MMKRLKADFIVKLGRGTGEDGKPLVPSVEGYYLGKENRGPNKFNPKNTDYVYIFQTPKGNAGVYNTKGLDEWMVDAVKGAMIKVEYDKKVTTAKGFKKHTFFVYQDKNNKLDPNDIPTDVQDNNSNSDSSSDVEDNSYSNETVEEEAEEEEQDPPPRVIPGMAASTAERKAKVEALLNRNKNK